MNKLPNFFTPEGVKAAREQLSQLTERDRDRIAIYAQDLGFGLHKIRSYPQGVTIFGSARLKETDYYYDLARKLGQLLAQNGHATTTGGGPGIMEAANRGAFEYGGRSIGLNIKLPHEQNANLYLSDSLEFEHFFTRKVILTMCSKAYAYFPGGFGTLDELSELLVLVQEGKMPKMPIFLVGKDFWKPLDKFFQTKMTKAKLIHANDVHLYKITDDIRDIVKAANRIGHPKVSDNLYDKYNRMSS